MTILFTPEVIVKRNKYFWILKKKLQQGDLFKIRLHYMTLTSNFSTYRSCVMHNL